MVFWPIFGAPVACWFGQLEGWCELHTIMPPFGPIWQYSITVAPNPLEGIVLHTSSHFFPSQTFVVPVIGARVS
jgi:hypothetical protein